MLDTNICALITKKDPTVLEAVKKHRNSGLYISAITLSEIEFGIRNSQNPQKYQLGLNLLLLTIRVLPYDSRAAMECGVIRADLQQRGCVIGNMDMLIAAHAKSAGMVLVTNNTGEFRHVKGLMLEDWKRKDLDGSESRQ
jgi:tRNA(fMet)-specific endonuclease VapC